MGREGTVMAGPCHQRLPNLRAEGRGKYRGRHEQGAVRAWSQGCPSFPSCLSFPSRPWLGSGCAGGEGRGFPRQEEEESLGGTRRSLAHVLGLLWHKLGAQVVRLFPGRDLTLGIWTPGSLLGLAAGSLHGFD